MNNSSLKKLALKAGVKRISTDACEELQCLGEYYLRKMSKTAIIFCDQSKKKIVSDDHVLMAAEYIGFGKLYKSSTKTGKCTKSQLNQQQTWDESKKQLDCTIFSKLPIEHLIREQNPNQKWTKEALINLQFALEHFLLKLASASFKITLNARRETLADNDIKVAAGVMDFICHFKI